MYIYKIFLPTQVVISKSINKEKKTNKIITVFDLQASLSLDNIINYGFNKAVLMIIINLKFMKVKKKFTNYKVKITSKLRKCFDF